MDVLTALVLCVVCVVVCAWLTVKNSQYANRSEAAARQPPDQELAADVEEIARVVERLSKASRSEHMRRVRAAAPNAAPLDPESPPQGPAGLQVVGDGFALPASGPGQETKEQLRRRLMGRSKG